jgi:hypothetical protein
MGCANQNGTSKTHLPPYVMLAPSLQILEPEVLRNSSACRYAHDQKDQANHQEQEEQEFSDSRSRNGNAGESKQRRNQRDYQKD